MTITTKTGRVLTDEDIQALADEAERGYDVELLRPVSAEEAARLREMHGVGQHSSSTSE